MFFLGICKYWDNHIPSDFFKRLLRYDIIWDRVDLDSICDPNLEANQKERALMVKHPKKYCMENMR